MISMELRKIIIENHQKGIKPEETSRVLGVGLSTVYKLIKSYKETGSIEPSYPGRQPKVTQKDIEAMEKLVIEQPDITIDEIIEKLNLPIKKSQVSNILRKLGFNFKKNKYTPENKIVLTSKKKEKNGRKHKSLCFQINLYFLMKAV